MNITNDNNWMPLPQQSSHPSTQPPIVHLPGAIYRRGCPTSWKLLSTWKVEYISDFIEQITGYPASCFTADLGNFFSQLIIAEDRKKVATTIERAVAHRHPYTVEYRLISRRQEVQWVVDRGQGVFDETGQLLGLEGLIFDITERKSVESELQQSETRFRKLARRESLLNYLSNQIRNSLDIDTVLQTVVIEVRQLLQVDRCSFCWYHPQQSYLEFTCEDREPDCPSYLGCYQIDLTNPIDRHNPLIQSLHKLTPHRVDHLAEASDFLTESRPHLGHYAYTAELFIPIATQAGRLGGIYCGHHRSPRPWTDDEVALLRAISSQCAIALDHAELYEQSRQMAQAAQIQAQQLQEAMLRLQQTQTQLIQTEKMSSLGQLVAGVAHEINNPVNFIYGNINHARGYIEDLLDLVALMQQRQFYEDADLQAKVEEIDLDFMTVDLPKLISSMEMGADRIRKIVLSLRSFSRLDESDKKSVDLHEGLDSTLLILQNRFKGTQNKPAILVIKKYGVIPPIECYAGQMNQVFMNILTNAIDALEEVWASHSLTMSANSGSLSPLPLPFSLKVPTITIQTETLNDDVVIRIADNGPGMPETIRTRLFDPFFTTKPVGQGTGLGLSISYQIVVEKHGGTLHCTSAPGQGTEFYIRIPLRMKRELS